MSSKMRRGFTLATDDTAIAVLPGDGILEIQVTVELVSDQESGDVVRGRVVLTTTEEIRAFMRDMRRAVKDAIGSEDEPEVASAPLFVNADGSSGGQASSPDDGHVSRRGKR